MEEDFYTEYSDLLKWHWWYVGRTNIIMNLVAHYTADRNQTLLDIGCGPGGMLEKFKQHGKVFGLDFSITSIQLCRKKGYYNTCVSRGENIPYKSGYFSSIFLLDILEHLEDENNLLKEAYRVCRPGGMIFITVPAFNFMWGKMDIIAHHRRRYTIDTLKSLDGLRDVPILKITYFNSLLFPIIALVRLFEKTRKKKRPKIESDESDFALNKPGMINNLLSGIFSTESKFLKNINLPFGVSILCIVKKPIDA